MCVCVHFLLEEDFLAADFLATDFLATDFLATDFLATDFLAKALAALAARHGELVLALAAVNLAASLQPFIPI